MYVTSHAARSKRRTTSFSTYWMQGTKLGTNRLRIRFWNALNADCTCSCLKWEWSNRPLYFCHRLSNFGNFTVIEHMNCRRLWMKSFEENDFIGGVSVPIPLLCFDVLDVFLLSRGIGWTLDTFLEWTVVLDLFSPVDHLALNLLLWSTPPQVANVESNNALFDLRLLRSLRATCCRIHRNFFNARWNCFAKTLCGIGDRDLMLLLEATRAAKLFLHAIETKRVQLTSNRFSLAPPVAYLIGIDTIFASKACANVITTVVVSDGSRSIASTTNVTTNSRYLFQFKSGHEVHKCGVIKYTITTSYMIRAVSPLECTTAACDHRKNNENTGTFVTTSTKISHALSAVVMYCRKIAYRKQVTRQNQQHIDNNHALNNLTSNSAPLITLGSCRIPICTNTDLAWAIQHEHGSRPNTKGIYWQLWFRWHLNFATTTTNCNKSFRFRGRKHNTPH